MAFIGMLMEMMEGSFWFKGILFVFGAVLGSFSNVIIVRWPQEKVLFSHLAIVFDVKKGLGGFTISRLFPISF